MPLDKIAQPGDPGTDDVYAAAVSDQRVARYRLPEHTSSALKIYSLVQDEMPLDGNSRRNLATLCTIWAEPEAHRLMDGSLDANMIDEDEYPQTAKLGNRRVHMISDPAACAQVRRTNSGLTTEPTMAPIMVAAIRRVGSVHPRP